MTADKMLPVPNPFDVEHQRVFAALAFAGLAGGYVERDVITGRLKLTQKGQEFLADERTRSGNPPAAVPTPTPDVVVPEPTC